jgi:uncharacterized MAPEG superfamily protein
MSIELVYLFLTTVLLAVMWMPYVIGQVTNKGILTPDDYRNLRDSSGLPAWAKRADRAHINLVEQYGAFAGLVVIAHLAGVSDGVTAGAAAVYFWARLLHAIVMISGFAQFMARTLIFVVSSVSLLVFAWQIAAAKLF